MKRLAWPLAAGLLLAPAWAMQDADAPTAEVAQAAQDALDDVIDEYDDAYEAWLSAARAAKTREERNAIEQVDVEGYAGRIRAIAERVPGTETAARATSWIVTKAPRTEHREWALETLLANHIKSEAMGDVCMAMSGDLTTGTEEMLRRVIAENPHDACKGKAKFTLANTLKTLTEVKNGASSARYYKDQLSDGRKAWLEGIDADDLRSEYIALFEDVAETGKDIIYYRDVTIGSVAAGELYELRNLQVGMVAPDIEGEDLDGTPFKLSDYRGKVTVIDFWGNW